MQIDMTALFSYVDNYELEKGSEILHYKPVSYYQETITHQVESEIKQIRSNLREKLRADIFDFKRNCLFDGFSKKNKKQLKDIFTIYDDIYNYIEKIYKVKHEQERLRLH